MVIWHLAHPAQLGATGGGACAMIGAAITSESSGAAK
jgi:hypothetical protein